MTHPRIIVPTNKLYRGAKQQPKPAGEKPQAKPRPPGGQVLLQQVAQYASSGQAKRGDKRFADKYDGLFSR